MGSRCASCPPAVEAGRLQVTADVFQAGGHVTGCSPQLWGGRGACPSHSSSAARIASKRRGGGYVFGLACILKENYKANKSAWPQLKSGGSDLSYVTTSLRGEGEEALLCEWIEGPGIHWRGGPSRGLRPRGSHPMTPRAAPSPWPQEEAEVQMEMRRSQARSPPPGALTCAGRGHGRALGAGFPSGHLTITFAGQRVEAVDRGRSVNIHVCRALCQLLTDVTRMVVTTNTRHPWMT